MLIVPIILNILFVSLTSSVRTYCVGVVDHDNTVFTQKVIDLLDKDCDIKILSKEEISDSILDMKVDIVVEFDENFTQDIINQKEVAAKTYSLQETNLSIPINLLIESTISAAKAIGKAAAGDSKVFYEGIDNYLDSIYVAEYSKLETSLTDEVERGVQSLGYIAMGMMFLLAFSTTLVLKDKITGIYYRTMVTPLTSKSYFFQNILCFILIALIQIIIVINVLPTVVSISYGDQVIEVILVCWSFSIVCIALGVAISRFAKNITQANALISFINLPLLMLGGCLWPKELMPDVMQKIGKFVPTTWFLEAAKKVLYGEGLMAASTELLYLFIFAIVFFVVSFTIRIDVSK